MSECVNGCCARQTTNMPAFDLRKSSRYLLLIASRPAAKTWPCVPTTPSPHYCLMRAQTSLQGTGSALIAAVWWVRGLVKRAVTHGTQALTVHSFSQSKLTPLAAAFQHGHNAGNTKCINNDMFFSIRRHEWSGRLAWLFAAQVPPRSRKHVQNFLYTSALCCTVEQLQRAHEWARDKHVISFKFFPLWWSTASTVYIQNLGTESFLYKYC